ncbi:hypothetical protein SPBR_03142 [Sporothrix brasiliensis 5110]|uniref:Uncharacterized protein n=1 Tax=Sporothrix brasiliensis 5110 TaxID=1398154 RepID=A0A0C2FMK1_9PEZI|nr:uncharacterized protein SPBR_03142 [Sporothrix brasiliensis 5110]KIH92303.1 hypothetical protein SPBR_03142 [Sporothrix brasiliensis 5110]
MTNAQIYHAFKSYVSRLHDVLSLRRNKKTKPRLVISAPFDFKKEDSMCNLPGVSGEELYMLREKAAASIVGSAFTNPYDTYSDSATLAPSSVHDLHLDPGSLNHSTSSFDKASLHHRHHRVLAKSMTAPLNMSSGATMAAPRMPTSIRSATSSPTSPTHHQHQHTCCRRCKSAATKDAFGHQRVGGGVSFYPPIVLASTEPYAPTGLSFPSTSSSASSISSRE